MSADAYDYLNAGVEKIDGAPVHYALEGWQENLSIIRGLNAQVSDLAGQAANVYSSIDDARVLNRASEEDIKDAGYSFVGATEGSESEAAGNLMGRYASAVEQSSRAEGPASAAHKAAEEARDYLRMAATKLGEAAASAAVAYNETGMLKADVASVDAAAEDYRQHLRRILG